MPIWAALSTIASLAVSDPVERTVIRKHAASGSLPLQLVGPRLRLGIAAAADPHAIGVGKTLYQKRHDAEADRAGPLDGEILETAARGDFSRARKRASSW